MSLEHAVMPAQEHRSRPPLVRQERPSQIPASPAQQRVWFFDQLEGTSTEYVMVRAHRLRGMLDGAALHSALRSLITRHETLRTRFAVVDSAPVQLIEPAGDIAMPVTDLRHLDEATQHARVIATLARQKSEPFDLGQWPLLRVQLLQLGAADHVLIHATHHIVSDGWSQRVFIGELFKLYEEHHHGQATSLPPLTVQYADYALWQREWLEEEIATGALEYWKRQLTEAPERLGLPADRPPGEVRSHRADWVNAFLEPEATAALKRLARAHKLTLYSALLTAYALVLSRYTGQDDVVIGLPIANRQASQLAGVIGFFVNTLPLRIRIRPEMTLLELLQDVQRTISDSLRWQDVPFERVVAELAPQRAANTTPLFQTIFALQDTRGRAPAVSGLTIESVPILDHVRTDLEVHTWHRDGRIGLSWRYNVELFDRWRIEQMARHYARAVNLLTADVQLPVWRVALLDEGEARRLSGNWKDTEPAPTGASLPALVEAQAVTRPDAIAAVAGDARITYGTWNSQANRLAHVLLARGLTADAVVALALPRSLEALVAVLAVQKAGAAYLALDPAYPAERLRFMLEDSSPSCVLTTTAAAPSFALFQSRC